MTECIHGLELERCDVCSPAPAGAPIANAKRRPAVTRRLAPAKARAVVRGTASARPLRSLEGERAYHVTHVGNFAAIATSGALRADISPEWDLSSVLTRDLRRSAEVSPGMSVAAYVPFFLSPAASRWEELRGGAVNSTLWSDRARAAASTDYIILVSAIGSLGEHAVVTDGDAAGHLTRFAEGARGLELFARIRDSNTALEAELLAPMAVPLSSIQLIGVANDRVRDRVRALTSIKVSVYPPWFHA